MRDLTTTEVAHLLGIEPVSVRSWAQRRGIRPVRVIRLGRANVRLWSADEVLAGRPSPRTEPAE